MYEISDCREAQDIFKEFLPGIDPSAFDPSATDLSAIEDVNLVLHCREEHPEGSLKSVLRIKSILKNVLQIFKNG